MKRLVGLIALLCSAGLCAQQMRPVTPPEVKRVEQKETAPPPAQVLRCFSFRG